MTVPGPGSGTSDKEVAASTTEPQHSATTTTTTATMVVVPRTSFGRVFVDNHLLEQAQLQGMYPYKYIYIHTHYLTRHLSSTI